ncbi:MAG TPA: NADH-quinone oxidoreductase subunit J [Pyrinomonadaceae bacterium]|jgi:NADH-quinone oxidoreductase subunit J
MISALLFILFGGLALGCAISMVAQRNPLYSAISLIGVFIALASLYLTLAAPFIAAVQVIVYAGAIMVLVVFVIMLLNVEEEERRPLRMRYLVPLAIALAAVLVAESSFILFYVQTNPATPRNAINSSVGLTANIGSGLFTKYLLPFEITSILLLMAIVGAMSLARRANVLPPAARVIPGTLVLPKDVIDPLAVGDATEVEADTTEEAARVLGFDDVPRKHGDD